MSGAGSSSSSPPGTSVPVGAFPLMEGKYLASCVPRAEFHSWRYSGRLRPELIRWLFGAIRKAVYLTDWGRPALAELGGQSAPGRSASNDTHHYEWRRSVLYDDRRDPALRELPGNWTIRLQSVVLKPRATAESE